LVPSFAFSSTKNPVNREIIGLKLGMAESEFLATVPARLQDTATGGPRVYHLDTPPDPDLAVVTASFYGGRLLKVDLEFTESFNRGVDWFELLRRFSSRYGAGRITQVEDPGRITDLADWGDGATQLVLRHRWRVDLDTGRMDSQYGATYVDSDYYVESVNALSTMTGHALTAVQFLPVAPLVAKE
jgi:hypothetical protein